MSARAAGQCVEAPLTTSATFLVLRLTNAPDAVKMVRSALASTGDVAKNVASRDQNASFSYIVGIGSDAWNSVTGLPRPKELHPFREIKGEKHTAVASPGDLLIHIRADRRDLCFEFERQLMESLGGAVRVEDETVGFRYFDARDLLGFVDGTANPLGHESTDSVLVTEADDEAGTGGSYVLVQKYLHNMQGWRSLSTDTQEAIIGRTKSDNVELDDAGPADQKAHKTLATVTGDDGQEYDILRDNMPFGSPASGAFGTYFIGYSRRLWVIEKMLERMFVGEPPGKHDRILDYSTPITGSVFFVPSLELLESLDDGD